VQAILNSPSYRRADNDSDFLARDGVRGVRLQIDPPLYGYGIHTSLTRMHLPNGPLYSRRLKMANKATTEQQVERTYSEKSRFAHSQAIDRTQEDV